MRNYSNAHVLFTFIAFPLIFAACDFTSIIPLIELPELFFRIDDLNEVNDLTVHENCPAANPDCDNLSVGIRTDDVTISFTIDDTTKELKSLAADIKLREYLSRPNVLNATGGTSGSIDSSFTLEQFDGERIRGVISGRMTSAFLFVLMPGNPNCVADDIVGMCPMKEPRNQLFRIEFDLPYQPTSCIGNGCK